MGKALISYSLTRRASQSRIAAAYQDILRERYKLVSTQDDADVVIVHHPPRNYETVYALHPALKDKYVISACVTHADDIPGLWQRNLPRVQEVWTCSRFCQQVLSRYHPKVTLLPYVVERDFSCSESELDCVKRLIGHEEGGVYFLNISPLDEPRKNVHTLVESFKKVAGDMPKARLIVKASHTDVPTWTPHPQVLFVPFQMPFEYISALYKLAHAYVSAHHAESWGITMSDAMLGGKPVIATGYSGNMDYMNEGNAFLLPYQESDVPRDQPGVAIEPGMKWADPDPDSLAESFRRLYTSHSAPETLEKVARAREDVGRFDRPRAAEIIYHSIESALQG
ncbi:MAG: glycosyltransferase family 4 protein [Thermoanaerobaculia bacterium]